MNPFRILATGPDLPQLGSQSEIDSLYRRHRVRIMLAITLGYGLVYTCRLALSMVKKPLIDGGIFSAEELGIIGSALFYTYAFGKLTNGFLADHAGDALWTLAAYLGLALLFPRARIRMIATGALGISFLVEFSQLLDWPWLAAARQTVPGSLLLGHGFLAIDLLRYAVGTTLGVVLDLAMIRLGTTSSCSSSGHTRRD